LASQEQAKTFRYFRVGGRQFNIDGLWDEIQEAINRKKPQP
jgi:hypothetical protein